MNDITMNIAFRVGSVFLISILVGCASGSSGSDAGFAVPNPYAIPGTNNVDQVKVNTIRAFGDSYTDNEFRGSTWINFLQAQGVTDKIENYAIGGAKAATGEPRAFDRQLNTWSQAKSPVADRDLTVIYLGYNDIGRRGNSLAQREAAKTGYTNGVNRLMAAGAITNERRLFVTQIHNWGTSPRVDAGVEPLVVEWNNYIAEVANSSPYIVAVDLKTTFDRVFASPASFGLTNVTDTDPVRSSVDWLFYDDAHFGQKGQSIIAKVYRHYLTRAWDWSNTVAAGTQAASRLNQDIDRGLLYLSDAQKFRPTTGVQLMSLYPQTNGARHAGQGAFGWTGDSFLNPQQGQGFIFHFNPARNAVDPDGVRHGFGAVLANTRQKMNLMENENPTGRQQATDAFSVYWQKSDASIMQTTQLSVLKHQQKSVSSDLALGFRTSNDVKSDAWMFEHKVRHSMQLGEQRLTPWLSFSHHSNRMSDSQVKSLYTSNVTYQGITSNELYARLGVDFQSQPIRFRDGQTLRLTAGLNYLASLDRQAYDVVMMEEAMPGVIQRERIHPTKIRQLSFGLGAALSYSKNVEFQADYALNRNGQAQNEAVQFRMNYKF